MFSCVPPWMMPIFTWKFRAWSVRAAEEAELRAAVHALPQHDPDVRTEVSPGLGRPPFAKTPAIQALDDHAATLAAACGLPSAGERVAGGGSDGNVTGALGVPMLDGLGAIGGGPHTREECIEPRCLVPRTRLPARLIATLGPGVGGL
jgi:glutamate carboxypeptidase